MDEEVEVRKLDCLSCGAPLSYSGDVDRVRCAYCGSELVLPRHEAQARPGGASSQPVDPPRWGLLAPAPGEKCPRCGRTDTTARVAGLVAAATAPAAGGPQRARLTGLAKTLAFRPPPVKNAERRGSSALGCWIPALIFALVMAALGSVWLWKREGVNPAAFPIAFVVILVFCLAMFGGAIKTTVPTAVEARIDQQTKINHMRRIYDSLCYCSGCDVIWVQDRQSVYRPDEIDILLRGAPKA